MKRLTRTSHLLDPWIDALEASREHLKSMLRLKRSELIQQASQWHFETAKSLRQRVLQVVGSMKYQQNPLGPKDLTDVISSFKRLREQAERDAVQAEKMTHSGAKGAKKARAAAQQSEAALRSFARQVRWELVQFGDWGKKILKALGVDGWL